MKKADIVRCRQERYYLFSNCLDYKTDFDWIYLGICVDEEGNCGNLDEHSKKLAFEGDADIEFIGVDKL